MRIALLYRDLDWGNRQIRDQLHRHGHGCVPFEVRSADARQLRDFDIVLNRVYASAANRDERDNQRALALVEALEATGVKCVNSWAACRADYDKHRAAQAMVEQGIRTPRTWRLGSPGDYRRQAEAIAAAGYPLIAKRNTGGRAVGIRKLDRPADLEAWLGEVFAGEPFAGHAACWVVQPYHRSRLPHDIRVAVIGGEFAYAYSRSLVPARAGEAPWLGSVSSGSRVGEYRPSAEEIALALQATAAIGAALNEVDMLVTEDGPMVIENNPTPSFIPGDEPLIGIFVDRLLAGRL